MNRMTVTQENKDVWKQLLCYGLQSMKDRQLSKTTIDIAQEAVDEFHRAIDHQPTEEPEVVDPVEGSVIPGYTCDIKSLAENGYHEEIVGEVFGE